MEFSINIKPTFEQVGKAFAKISEGFKLQQELERFAYSVEGEAKRVTPVDTGRLRASISTNVQALRVSIAPHTNYAFFVHEGHRTKGGGYVAGRPFLTTGLEVVRLKTWGSSTPFMPHIQKVIEDNIKAI